MRSCGSHEPPGPRADGEGTDLKDIAALIEAIVPDIVSLRHELHAHPELGYEEVETSRRVRERLERLPGLRIRSGMAKTGVVATLNATKPGPCVALRADMDCLPITEETGAAYASKTPGRMHACGH